MAFGLYTGQRLGDLSLLTWDNLDLSRGEVWLVTRKTGRQMILLLVKPPRPFVDALTSERAMAQPLFCIGCATSAWTESGCSSLAEARVIIEDYRCHYNEERPHGGPGHRTSRQAFHEARPANTKVANTAPAA
ncbi:MAG: transposase [Rhodospirillales bacterium]|nr:transposase [Acetobacter sp.]